MANLGGLGAKMYGRDKILVKTQQHAAEHNMNPFFLFFSHTY